MIGWTHICIGMLITRKYGLDIWNQIKRKSGFTEETEFETQTYYDDTETMRIFRTAAGVLGLSVDDMWEMYGEFLITWACETGWEKMLACMANNLQDFLDNLNAMHYFIDQIAFKSEMRGPTFHCEPQGENGLRLHYFSNRQGLFPIVKGLVRRTARVLYEMDVKVNMVERSQERRKIGLVEHVVFSIEPDDDHKVGRRMAYKFRREITTSDHLRATDVQNGHSISPILLRDLVNIFPYHICFNKQLVIEHVGSHLLREYGLSEKKMVKLTELVQLVQPSDIQLTHKNIISYLNTLFIFQLKHHCKRNEVDKGSSEAFQQPLSLKGQMMSVNGGSSIIFLCSPHVTTVRDILNLKLFISDMPMHDATRDLVMLNQSRICQMELNKKLEETVKKLKGLADELERKKAQTDHLLFEFVPKAVADAIRQSKAVPAQEFSECTVMFSDIPDFFSINMNCKPHEVIDLVTDLFHRFDRLIEKHKCYKVLSLMDTYLIVGGVPNACQLHSETILNLALGMIFEGRQVKVPGMELPLRVRIGVHCGPVVAGIVSQKKPRYCVLGQTVMTAKAMCNASKPGKILVSNTLRTSVAKQNMQNSVFTFTSSGFIDFGPLKIMTHYLEKNEMLSVWQLVDMDKPSDCSIDGYKELHSDEGNSEWDEAMEAAVKQQNVIDAFRIAPSRTNRAIGRLQSMKRKFLNNQSNDSGVSVSVDGSGPESTVCSIM